MRWNLSPRASRELFQGTRVHIMIASEGYLYVPQCIKDKALRALRAEADSLFNLKRSKCALSEDEYFDKVTYSSISTPKQNVLLRTGLLVASLYSYIRSGRVSCKRLKRVDI